MHLEAPFLLSHRKRHQVGAITLVTTTIKYR